MDQQGQSAAMPAMVANIHTARLKASLMALVRGLGPIYVVAIMFWTGGWRHIQSSGPLVSFGLFLGCVGISIGLTVMGVGAARRNLHEAGPLEYDHVLSLRERRPALYQRASRIMRWQGGVLYRFQYDGLYLIKDAFPAGAARDEIRRNAL